MSAIKKNKLATAKKQPAKEPTNDNDQFPGYPQYSPDEDIFRKGKRIDENLEDSDELLKKTNTKVSSRLMPTSLANHSETTGSQSTNPTDVTKEDLQALGPKDLSLDMGDDEQLKQRLRPVDFSGKDLDVPGSEADDLQENIGSEDEENNLYSQAD